MRNMSFAMTTEQAWNKIKTVTRRQGWWYLKPGTLIQQVEKGQGLKKDEHVKKIHVIRIVSVETVFVYEVTHADVVKEGFPDWTPDQFIEFYCKAHKLHRLDFCNRIEFEYVEDQ